MKVDRKLVTCSTTMFTEQDECAALDIQQVRGQKELADLLATIRRLGLIPGLIEIRVYPLMTEEKQQ